MSFQLFRRPEGANFAVAGGHDAGIALGRARTVKVRDKKQAQGIC